MLSPENTTTAPARMEAMVPIETLRQHVSYTAWATRRLIETASKLTEDELTQDFHTADRSIIGTLAHTFGAGRLWLARLQDAPCRAVVTDEDRDLAVLLHEWPLLHDRWADWMAGLDENAPETAFSYVDLKGRRWTQPLWQLVFHVVNHDTHHRGQVAGFIRSLGHTPPPLDLVAYYREQMNS